MNIGRKRNTIDKYYTTQEIVKNCIDLIKKYISINKHDDIIIEPSAGNGSFINSIKILCDNHLFYDLKPEHTDIVKKDFLKFNKNTVLYKYKKIHIIGNPPFGRQSSLAIKFIKKCCEFCDTISFILPKSFKKTSLKNKIPLNFHLLLEKDLPPDSFIINDIKHDVPCVFQIWIKKYYDRIKEPKHISKYFYFVTKNDRPDLAIRRIGANAGKVYDDIHNKNINSHYFIKIKSINKNNTISLIKKYNYNLFNNSVGPLSISKQELIKFYNEISL
jgi:hypothetical protein